MNAGLRAYLDSHKKGGPVGKKVDNLTPGDNVDPNMPMPKGKVQKSKMTPMQKAAFLKRMHRGG